MQLLDRPKVQMEPIVWDAVPRGNSATMPFRLSKQSRRTGNIIPYNLQGSVLMLTVKKDLFDGDSKQKAKAMDPQAEIEDIELYNKQLKDETAIDGMGDMIFRITVDCDDPTKGATAPLWVTSEDWGAKEVFHGMYGDDPKDGQMVFRIPKKMMFIDPGTYNFDIRILFKQDRTIGELHENPAYLLTYGTFEVYGSPNNRSTYQNFSKFGG